MFGIRHAVTVCTFVWTVDRKCEFQWHGSYYVDCAGRSSPLGIGWDVDVRLNILPNKNGIQLLYV